jgi:hypothetical protein
MTYKRAPIYRSWSPEDDEQLKRLASMGATLLRASAALGRRGPIIRKRANELGLHFVGTREAKRRVRLLTEFEANDGNSLARP